MSDKQPKSRRTMPFWLGILFLAVSIASLASTCIAVVANYKIVLPIVGDIQFINPQVRVDTLDFSHFYNTTTNRYTQCQVNITNFGTGAQNVQILISMYNNARFEIASGSNTATLATAENLIVSVNLNWKTGYTVANLTSSQLQVICTPL